MPDIFVSYRRSDSPAHAGRLYDCLQSNFGESNVFMDVDSLAPGEDRGQTTKGAVAECDVLLAVIGDDWLSANGEEQRSLDDPVDPVRLQLEHAFEGGVKVIPVLVEGAQLPSARQLPPSLERLARYSPLELSDAHWRHDTEKLLEAVGTTDLGRVQSWLKNNRLRKRGKDVLSGMKVVTTLVSVGRIAVAVVLVAAATISGIGLLRGSSDDAPDYRSFPLRAAGLTLGVPAEWSVSHLDASSLVLESTKGLPRIKLRSEVLDRPIASREYAASQGAKYRRSLDAYRELEVGPIPRVPAWRGGYLRMLVFDSPAGSAEGPNAKVDVYYSRGKRVLTASAETKLKPPVEDTLHRLRNAVLSIRPSVAGR